VTPGTFGALAAGAATVGALHTLAPDHWVPFAALGRARRWSTRRTIATTAVCGLGHVTVSVMLGLLALVFGLEMLELFGRRMESAASLLLIAFGLTYAVIGLRRALGRRLADVHDHGSVVHHHAHSHGVLHEHAESATLKGGPTGTLKGGPTAWTLFVLFCADPCVAVIPVLFASAPLGAARTTLIVGAYELATIGTMVGLVLAAGAATARVRGAWLNVYGDAAAGAVIAAVGVAVTVLGW